MGILASSSNNNPAMLINNQIAPPKRQNGKANIDLEYKNNHVVCCYLL